jgi:hypothetical protein
MTALTFVHFSQKDALSAGVPGYSCSSIGVGDFDLQVERVDMTSDVPESDAPRRNTKLWIAVGAAVAILAVLVAVLIIRGTGRGGTASGQPSYAGSAPPTASGNQPSPEATTPVPSVSIPKPTATGSPTVVPTHSTTTTSAPMGDKVVLADGVEVEVSDVKSVKGEAQGPGEIAGPAVRVTLDVRNKSDKDVSMSMAVVNLYYGSDKTPASTLSGPGLDPLPAAVAAGSSATGSYVFSVPENDRNQVVVEFSYSTESPTVLFSGKA